MMKKLKIFGFALGIIFRLVVLILLSLIMINQIRSYLVDSHFNEFARQHPSTVVPSLVMIGCLLCFSAAAFLVHLVLSGFQIAALGEHAPAWITRILTIGRWNFFKEQFRQRVSPAQRTVLSLAAWGMFIFSFVTVLSVEQTFENKETFFLNYSSRAALLTNAAANDPDEPVCSLRFYSEDNNVRKYYRDVYTIAKELKASGAKVIVADVPTVSSVPGMFPLGLGDVSALYAKIDSLGVVVWTQRMPPWAYLYYARNQHLRFDQPGWRNVYPAISAQKDVSDEMPYPDFAPLVRWQPFVRADRFTFPEFCPDVALAVARKYFDIPDTCALSTDGNSVRMGNVRIPVSSSGIAYSDNVAFNINNVRQAPVTASRGVVIEDGFESHPDSLRYNARIIGSGVYPISPSGKIIRDTVTDLSHYRGYFAGKAVVINWMSGNTERELYAKISEANVISSVLRQSFYTKVESLTYVLMMLAIVVIALLSAFCRVQWTVYGTLLIIIGTTAFADWIFSSYRVLFDPLYPIVAAVISGIIFSLVKIAREAR
jgi:hypothetical protein